MASREELLQQAKAKLDRESLLEQARAKLDAQSQSETPEEIGALESGLRGAAQWGTFGFADEAAGGLDVIADAIKSGKIGSTQELLDKYAAARDAYRKKDDLAWEQHPYAYGTGAAVGGFGSAVIPGAIFGRAAEAGQGARALTQAESIADTLNKAKKLGMLGGIGAAGMSNTKVLENIPMISEQQVDDLRKNATQLGKDVSLGTITSPGIGIAAETAIPAFIDAAKRGASKLGRSTMNAVFGVPEEVTKRYMEAPEAVNAAPSREEFAKKLVDTLKDIKEESSASSKDMMSALSGERQINKNLGAERVIKMLRSIDDPNANKLADSLSSELESRAPFRGQEPRPATITRKMEFTPKESPQGPNPFQYEINYSNAGVPAEISDLIMGYDKSTGAPIYRELKPIQAASAKYEPSKQPMEFEKILSEKRINEVPPTPEEALYLTEKEAHSAKRALQDAGDYNSALPKSYKAAANEQAGELNRLLRSSNPEYASLADDVQKDIVAKKELASKFGLKADYLADNKLNYTDRTMSAISDLSRANKVDRSRVLDLLNELGYGDLNRTAKDALAKEAFSSSNINGSRGVNLWKGLAGGILGHQLGIPGAEAMGAFIGSQADKYGPAVGKRLLDVGIGAERMVSPVLNKIPVSSSQIGAFSSANMPRLTQMLSRKSQENYVPEKQAAEDYLNRK